VATPAGRPGRTLVILFALVVVLVGLMGLSNTWKPKLGLDLQGGTTITLTAANTSGTGSVDPNSLELARTIIQSRVDSLGVGESEVTTSGNRQINVSVPNVQQDRLVQLVGQTAVLRFRAVYAAEQVTPPAPPSPAPSEAGSASPAAATAPKSATAVVSRSRRPRMD
jgi:preprotein translocase subunit SecD